MKKILIIRHAESIGNAGAITTLPGEIPLSLTGITQAHELVGKITDPPEIIVYSKYIRTYQTAEPLINTFPHVPTEEWSHIHEFTYLNEAHCANMDAKSRQPMVDEYWDRNDPHHRDGGSAESFVEFLRRIDSSINQVKVRQEKSIIIFSHGNFILGLKMLIESKKNPGSLQNLSDFMLEFRKRKEIDFPENTSIFDASEMINF